MFRIDLVLYTTAVITGTPKVILSWYMYIPLVILLKIIRNSKKGWCFFPCYFGGKELASSLRMENNTNCLVRIEICANYFCSSPSLLGN